MVEIIDDPNVIYVEDYEEEFETEFQDKILRRYLGDIYKTLFERSEEGAPGITKIAFIKYS